MTNESQFLIYCIQKYSQVKNIPGPDVVDLFDKYSLQDYILEFSELIQAQGDLDHLKIRSFQMDEDWLEYVFNNRHLKYIENEWDVIFGPVADDQTMTTLGLYLDGRIKAYMAIEMLLPQKLKDQYCFKTEAALSCLQFMEAIQ